MTAPLATGTWALQALRDLLVAFAGKPGRCSSVGAVAKALALHLKSSDLTWVIDLFIHRSRAGNRWILASLFEVFAPNEALMVAGLSEPCAPRSPKLNGGLIKAAGH